MRVLLATSNPGKIAELTRELVALDLEVIGLESLSLSDVISGEIIETGSTFGENALLKARYYFEKSGLVTIADDSGIEVDALKGRPGIYSARYAGPNATDAQRTGHLLEEMSGVASDLRGARFVCAAAIVWSHGEKDLEGECGGRILGEGGGGGGFGYDPIFYSPPLGRTFAELSHEEKWLVSHRGRAFRSLARWLSEAGTLVDTNGSGDRINDPAKNSRLL